MNFFFIHCLRLFGGPIFQRWSNTTGDLKLCSSLLLILSTVKICSRSTESSLVEFFPYANIPNLFWRPRSLQQPVFRIIGILKQSITMICHIQRCSSWSREIPEGEGKNLMMLCNSTFELEVLALTLFIRRSFSLPSPFFFYNWECIYSRPSTRV